MLMFAGHQLLGQLEATFVYIFAGAVKMMVDPNLRRATGITGQREYFIDWLSVINLILSERTRSTDGEQFCRDPNKACEKKLLALQLRSKASHRMKQSSGQAFAGASGITN